MQPAPAGGDAYRAPVGTHDVLPPESGRWEALVAAFAARARRFGGAVLAAGPAAGPDTADVHLRPGELRPGRAAEHDPVAVQHLLGGAPERDLRRVPDQLPVPAAGQRPAGEHLQRH